MTIEQANLLQLRPAMNVIVTVHETSEVPTDLTPTNILTDYEENARVTADGERVILMDLCDGGFLADGNAQPISEAQLVGSQKYGYISSEIADSDGAFTNPITLTIESDYEWEYITYQLCDSRGNVWYQSNDEVEWVSGVTTETFSEGTPNERLHILQIILGKAFIFEKDDLTSLQVHLRGVNEDLEKGTFEMSMSEAEIEAYMGENADSFTEVYERMEKLSPCHIQIGYDEDSVDRTFYLSDSAEYDSATKVLKIKVADATLLLDSEVGGSYELATTTNSRQKYYDAIKDILTNAGIVPIESGTVPTGSGTDAANILIKNESARNIIADAVGMNRNAEHLMLTYRDGGIPELIVGYVPATHSISESDVADLTRSAELKVKTYTGMIESYSASSTAEEVARVDNATANTVYIVEASEPVASISSATSGCTAELITPYKVKITTTTSGNKVVNGYKVVTAQENASVTADRRGIETDLGEMPKLKYGVASGGLPSGYQQVEWIGASGTQYINTGYTFTNKKLKIEQKYRKTSSLNLNNFGVDLGSGTRQMHGHIYNTALYLGNGAVVSSVSQSLNTDYVFSAEITDDSATWVINNSTYTYNGLNGWNGATNPDYIFATNNGSGASYKMQGRIYYHRMYDENGDLVRDFVPCYRTSDSVIGMYDTVNDEFYTNAGTGTFTKGSDVEAVTYYSLTEQDMEDMLSRENEIYTFKWRGNPRWQCFDHISMTMLDGTTKDMTIEEISLDMSDGGLVSEIKARGGAF